jgi:dephospho-CoA kinase
VAVLISPLLFETGVEGRVDKVVVVTAPEHVQKARMFERPNMTEEKFRAILARQMPDSEKRQRADFVIDTSRGFEAARADVRSILRQVAERKR